MTMRQSKPNWSSYVQFTVQTVILITLVVLLGYMYIQDDRLKELEKRMATMSIKFGSSKLTVVKAVNTLLKNMQESDAINSRLEMVENKVNELLKQYEDFVSDNYKTSKQLIQIESKTQSMKRGFGKTDKYLENFREKRENTDQMLQQLKDELANVSNRKKIDVSPHEIFQTYLDEIQTDTKLFKPRESDLKHLSEMTVKIQSSKNNPLNIVRGTNRDTQEPTKSHQDGLDEQSKAIETEKGISKNVEHITASDSCQTGIVAMDQPISTDEERLVKVQFGNPFSSLPVISYGIMKLDTNAPSNPRIWVTLKDQSTTGFTASFTTWLGSIVYECAISWMACARS